MRKIGIILASILAVCLVGLSAPVFAEQEFSKGVCDSDIADDLKAQAGCDVEDGSLSNTAVNIINIIIAIIGIIAVVVIVIGGVQYSVSLGDPGKIQQAKNMIIYAVVAVIVAALAWGIVQVVVASVPTLDAAGTILKNLKIMNNVVVSCLFKVYVI